MSSTPQTEHQMQSPIVLCILDGWANNPSPANNAVKMAKTPNFDTLIDTYPTAELMTCGDFVGLPDGQMGNSEVGHTNIGAGRTVMQDLPRINHAVANNTMGDIPLLKNTLQALKSSGQALHLMGLVSDGGVHAHQDHMAHLANLAHAQGIKTYIHALTDGRDTAPKSAKSYMEKLIKSAPHATLATITGRYFAMDRDNNWQRTQSAYHAIISAQGDRGDNVLSVIDSCYGNDITDEFIPAHVLGDYTGVGQGDVIIMTNFRADRARQIMMAFAHADFDGFTTDPNPFSTIISMTEYSEALNTCTETLFPPESLDNVLGQVLADNAITQLRVAETEKYAHVTFFLNGGREDPFALEDRILIPSPKVATYDLQPTMGTVEIGDAVAEALLDKKHRVIIVNFAAPDMVGHTGDLNAAIVAVETVDTALGTIVSALNTVGGTMIVTADHGNCDMMVNSDTGEPHTAHTLFPVPVCLVSNTKNHLKNGRLADLAPTLLNLLDIPVPNEMNGQSLLS